MSIEKKIDPFAVIILVLSVIGLILLVALDFAGFYLSGYGNRYSCLGCEYSTSVDLVAQVIILILLIIQIIISLNDLLPNKFIEKDLSFIGMILAGLTILFFVIGIGSFGIEHIEDEWWLETGGWGVLIAGLLNTMLFFLKFRNK
ncbi:MAG: hypothetical protein ACFFC3_03890 [Candidatus Odinarchaeota archaeon]